MPKLEIIDGPLKGRFFEFDDGTIFIGRSSRNDIQIKDPTISRKQIKLYFIGKKLFLEDLKSTNGTWLNEELIPPGEGYEVEDGDIISLGTTLISFDCSSPDARSKQKSYIPPAPLNRTSPKEERRKSALKDLETLYSITKLIRSTMDLQEMIGSVLETLLDTLPRIERAAVILLEGKKRERRKLVCRTTLEAGISDKGFSHKVIDRVIGEGKAVRMSNMEFEAPSNASEDENTLEIGSLLCVPLISHDTAYGVLYVDSLSGPYGFRKDDLLFLNSMSGPLALAIENALIRNS